MHCGIYCLDELKYSMIDLFHLIRVLQTFIGQTQRHIDEQPFLSNGSALRLQLCIATFHQIDHSLQAVFGHIRLKRKFPTQYRHRVPRHRLLASNVT
jgi:hypothetical protein